MMETKIKLQCETCGAPITHVIPSDDWGHIYKCDYCGMRYYVSDDKLERYYEEPELEESQELKDKPNPKSAGGIITLAIGIVIVAILFPIALSQINRTTGWNSNISTIISTMYGVFLPIIIIIGFASYFIKQLRT